MHRTRSDGTPSWITPYLIKANPEGKERVEVNRMDNGPQLALAVGYVVQASNVTNITARKNSHIVVAALGDGNPKDRFILSFPVFDDKDMETDKRVDTESISREDLLKMANGLIEVDSLLSPVEGKAQAIGQTIGIGLPAGVANPLTSYKVLNANPYSNGKRGKRAGGKAPLKI